MPVNNYIVYHKTEHHVQLHFIFAIFSVKCGFILLCCVCNNTHRNCLEQHKHRAIATHVAIKSGTVFTVLLHKHYVSNFKMIVITFIHSLTGAYSPGWTVGLSFCVS
jgi:hypothetical protein